MLKKILIAALVVWLAIVFYNKFIADTIEPFFKRYESNVDLFSTKTSVERAPVSEQEVLRNGLGIEEEK